MDPNTTMEAVAEGAKAATKMGEIVEKIFGPHWTRKQADADAYADEKKLQIIRSNPDMDIVYVDGKLHAREKTPEAIAYRAELRLQAELARQEKNLENVIELTAANLATEETVSSAPVDDDWLARYVSIAKDISNEEMQYVWGQILSGEIKKPGSFSLRTLETLRNISQKEAAIFQKILPFIISMDGDFVVLSEESILKKYKLLYSDILCLDECGLFMAGSMLTLNAELSGDEPKAVVHGNRVIVLKAISSQTEKISMGIYCLTTAGKELAQTLNYDANEEYTIDVAKHFYETKKGKITTSIHDINWKNNEKISYKTSPIKAFPEESNEIS